MVHRVSVNEGKAWRQGLALWLLLLSIFTHAVVPAGSPLVRTSGSAFSATTAEVAIPPKRNMPADEQAAPGGGSEGSSEGAGYGDDPSKGLSVRAASVPWPAERTEPPYPAYPNRTQEGGAAPFSARAPPSI
jgi:hypothetical protein